MDIFSTFRGKVRAAACRKHFHDSADIRWLEGKYHDEIRAKKDQLQLQFVGLAIKRYPELEYLFQRLDVDVPAALSLISDVEVTDELPQALGDVQKGILG